MALGFYMPVIVTAAIIGSSEIFTFFMMDLTMVKVICKVFCYKEVTFNGCSAHNITQIHLPFLVILIELLKSLLIQHFKWLYSK